MSRIALHWQILIGMVAGATLGLTLNWGWSDRQVTVAKDDLPADVQLLSISDSRDRIVIEFNEGKGLQRLVVDPSQATDQTLQTVDKLKEKHPREFGWFYRHGRSTSRRIGDAGRSFGNLFLRLLRMVAVPLIVTSLTVGILGLGSAGKIGKLFSRTVLYYICTSTLAIITGLVVVNIINPGVGSDLAAGGPPDTTVSRSLGEVLFQQLETMIPTNPIEALAEANYLSIISFTMAFAIFALLAGGSTAETIHRLFKALVEVMMKMTMAIISLAPIGVMLLMLHVTATQGPGIFLALAWYMLAVLIALAIHAFVTLPLILWLVAGRNPLDYARSMSPALLTAFSSASSNGTLPLTMTCAEQRAGVPSRVGSFVLPLGATINMDGTALYEVIAVLFIAQLSGLDLTLTQQLIVAVTALLASIGAAGIPHAGLVMMIIILEAVGLPVEKQAIIIAVDRVLDMCRTSVNVWSDSCGCAVVASLEEESVAASTES